MVAQKALKIGRLEGAPEWYGTPFDKLSFEWTREEKLELQRYCERILKNASEEDMTPRQRFEATYKGKDKDRLFIDPNYMAPFATRTLDSWADTVKPGDIYKRPKLHVKCHLAMVARYKLDTVDVYTTTYGEHFWGADARMMDYATPMIIGDPPIKTMEDVQSCEVPDPWKHGLYPGYLWGVREIMNIMKHYEVDKVMPIEVSYCGGPLGTAIMGNMMMSMPSFMRATRKDPELAKAVINLASQWSIKFGKAVKSFQPDAMYMCDVTGSTAPDNTGWLMDYYAMIGKAVRGGTPTPYQYYQIGGPGWQNWMALYPSTGAVGKDSYDGWWIGPDMPYQDVYRFSREHDLYCSLSVSDLKMIEGDWSIEEDIKGRCAEAKKHPRHGIAVGVVDYWTPQPHLDKCLAWERKYGKF